MTTKRLKDLNRIQLTKLIKNNQPHLQVRKNMTLSNLRSKLNFFSDFSWVTWDKNWVIKDNHSL